MTDTIHESKWPPRPDSGIFSEVLDTLLVAQLLLYDVRGMTPEQGRRDVRKLVKETGLPVLGKIGSTLMFSKAAVLDWLGGRNMTVGTREIDAIVDAT